jgi:hypothetical protein
LILWRYCLFHALAGGDTRTIVEKGAGIITAQ